jgi:hypothetical protein
MMAGKKLLVIKEFSIAALLFALINMLGIAAFSHAVRAEEKSKEALAKAAQNPVADLISLPLQNNTNFGVGPGDDVQNVLNIQPVMPVELSENWNLITRTIAPVIYQPELVPGYGSEFGLGDINTTLFLSPAKPGKIIWGVGPVFSFPTASDRVLGTDKWSAGPSAVVLTIRGPWVVGALANNLWSYAGDDDRKDVNQFLLQYFINYNLPKGWYISSAPIITANWKADSGNKWTVPFGGGIGKIFRIGKQPVNAQVQAFYNAVKPDNGPDWTLRLQLQFLFPK